MMPQELEDASGRNGWIATLVALQAPSAVVFSQWVGWLAATAWLILSAGAAALSVVIMCRSHARAVRIAHLQCERARHDSRLANAARAESLRLVATLCHDLRQPGFAIEAHAEQLLESAGSTLNEVAAMAAAGLRASQRFLHQLLCQTLDLARLEAGMAAPQMRPVHVTVLVQDLLRQMSPLADSRGVRVVAYTRPAAIVWADELMLQRVLSNLIDNATAHTPAGRVVVVATRRSIRGWRIQVRDPGQGIPTGGQTSIFADYLRLESPEAGGRDGYGMGLSISRRLVLVMGGRIDVRSSPGRGCCMTVSLRSHAEPTGTVE